MPCMHPDDFDHINNGNNACRRLMTFVAWHQAGVMKFPGIKESVRKVRWWVENHPNQGFDLTGFPKLEDY